MMIPIAIDYLGATKYGIWITVFSVLMWVRILDVGLGNGLRNRVAEAIAKEDIQMAKMYISTTYLIVSVIMVSAFVIFIIVYPYVDWIKIFNAPDELRSEIGLMVLTVFCLICLRFIFQLIFNLCQANQEPAFCELIDASTALLSLLAIIIISQTTSSSLIYFALAVSIAPIAVLVLFHIYLFSTKYKIYLPSIRFVDFSHAKSLTRLGINFFIIQIASLILFSTSNFLITYLFSPQEVTKVHVANSYFNILLMFFLLMVSPLWSAVTDAYHKGDLVWIKSVVQKLLKYWFIVVFLAAIMLAVSSVFYSVWIGDRIHIPFSVTLVVALLRLYSEFPTAEYAKYQAGYAFYPDFK